MKFKASPAMRTAWAGNPASIPTVRVCLRVCISGFSRILKAVAVSDVFLTFQRVTGRRMTDGARSKLCGMSFRKIFDGLEPGGEIDGE
jgi:hypothetical protein